MKKLTKMEFLAKIRLGLSSLTEDEIQRSFEFYREMIDDRIEDGLTEEEAVAAAGDPNEIIRNILAESTPKKQVQKPQTEQNKQIPQKKSSNSGWTLLAVLLIILGSPLWIPLIIAAVAIVIAIFAVIISVIIALYAVVLSLGIVALALLAMALTGSFAKGILLFGAALICAGLTILSLFAVNFIVKLLFLLCKALFSGIKSIFVRRKANDNC